MRVWGTGDHVFVAMTSAEARQLAEDIRNIDPQGYEDSPGAAWFAGKLDEKAHSPDHALASDSPEDRVCPRCGTVVDDRPDADMFPTRAQLDS